MSRIVLAAICLLLALSPASAQDSRPAPAPPDSLARYKKETLPVPPKVTPQHITVQHILIAFEGSTRKPVDRKKDEARKLAYEILEMARMGADFDTLVMTWTNDSYPGTYNLANFKVPVKGKDEYPREDMVAAFGNVGFAISPGNIGIADFDPKTSKYGWHIIKRLK